MMYYAERQTSDVNYFVGLFSSTDRAKSATAKYRQWLGDDRELLWIGFGDSLRCSTPWGIYCILPMEIDRNVVLGEIEAAG